MRIKRLWFTLLIALMMLSLVAITSAASVTEEKSLDIITEVNPSVALSEGVVKNTDEGVAIDFTLKVVNNPGVSILGIKVNYNTDKLVINSGDYTWGQFGAEGDLAKVRVDAVSGTVLIDYVSIVNSSASMEDCTLVTLHFNLNPNFHGNFIASDFEIETIDAMDADFYGLTGKAEPTATFKAHHYAAVEDGVQVPTCTEPGTASYKCTKCDDTHTVTTETPVGHQPVTDAAVDATCSATGLTEGSHCGVCNETIVAQQEIPVNDKNHTPAEMVIENANAPTCTVSGSHQEVVYCADCEKELDRKTVEDKAPGHTPAEAVKENDVLPTCTADGSYDMVVYCTVCEEEVSRETTVVNKLGHTPAEAVKENDVLPTCTADGSYDMVVYCTVCNEKLSSETTVVNKLGHTPAEAVKENDVLPTCVTDGSYDMVVYCTVCEAEVSRENTVVPMLGHTEAIDAKVEPTCTENGKTEGKHCSVCSEVLLPQDDIPALGHKWGEWKQTVAPTTSEKGKDERSCSACDAKEEREVAKLPVITASAIEWKKGNEALVFTSDAAFADFIKVTINGEVLAEGDYTVAEGSTVVTLSEEYLRTLAKGGYEIAIHSTNGTAKVTFTVQNSNALWIVLIVVGAVLVCGVVAAYVVIYMKKKRTNA